MLNSGGRKRIEEDPGAEHVLIVVSYDEPPG
jgi:hypothetical protein